MASLYTVMSWDVCHLLNLMVRVSVIINSHITKVCLLDLTLIPNHVSRYGLKSVAMPLLIHRFASFETKVVPSSVWPFFL